MRARILVSACLAGQAVRYDGQHVPLHHPIFERWKEEDRLVPFCPETAVGFTAPRPPAEIVQGANGADVLNCNARVVDKEGSDHTERFVQGAWTALTLARKTGCRYALLKENSPSCGVNLIYDGDFTGRRHGGSGVTATLLRRHGITVFSETEIERLIREISGR